MAAVDSALTGLAPPPQNPTASARGGAVHGLRALLAGSRPLRGLFTAMFVLTAAALLGLAFDARVITGAPAWMKPAKFAISIVFYSLTFVWLLGFVHGHPRHGVSRGRLVGPTLASLQSHRQVAHRRRGD